MKKPLNTKLLYLLQALAALITALGWALPCRAGVNDLDSRQPGNKGKDLLKQSKQSDIFAVYLFDPRKYNDLSIRAFVLQRQQELYPSAPSSSRDAAYNRLALEYLRRIGSGYTTDTVRTAQDTQTSKGLAPKNPRHESDDDVLTNNLSVAGQLAYTMTVAYQPLVISNAMEGRLHYDIAKNSMDVGLALGALGAPHSLAEFRYYITEQPLIPVIPREYLANAMEAVDQVAPMDRATLTLSHRLDKVGLTGRTRYALNEAVLSYGVSKTIAGPLVAHIIKEDDFKGGGRTSRSGVIAMVSYAVQF